MWIVVSGLEFDVVDNSNLDKVKETCGSFRWYVGANGQEKTQNGGRNGRDSPIETRSTTLWIGIKDKDGTGEIETEVCDKTRIQEGFVTSVVRGKRS